MDKNQQLEQLETVWSQIMDAARRLVTCMTWRRLSTENRRYIILVLKDAIERLERIPAD